MALTAKQQRNIEALVDQHFTEVRRALQDHQQSLPYPQFEVTPELKQLAEAQAKEEELRDRTALDSLTKYNAALESLGYPAQAVPYALTGTETTEHRAERLVLRVKQATQDQINRADRARLDAAWEQIDVAWRKARRDILIASLDGSGALVLIEGLPDLATLLADTTTEETPA
jgi:hypothetical protein